VVSKTLFLKHGKRIHTLINSGLNRRSHTEARSRELNTHIHVRGSDLNLLALRKEVKMESLQAIKNHNPSLTQVNHKLALITKGSQTI